MKLSKNFTLEEMLVSNFKKIDNSPTNEIISKLEDLCTSIIQPIRDKWGALSVTSGFRCRELNVAVGGSNTSQHCFGEAVDFIPVNADVDEVFKWIVKESNLNFGQCINEQVSRNNTHWIHISLPTAKHKQDALVYEDGKYRTYFKTATTEVKG